MSTKAQNERKFQYWVELPEGGRRYILDVPGRMGWLARYIKEVDGNETTICFYQRFMILNESLSKYVRNTQWIKATKKFNLRVWS